jgi:hypothetical protein
MMLIAKYVVGQKMARDSLLEEAVHRSEPA